MKVELISTQSGEHTLYNTELDETYHNRIGAISESIHVFIEEGLSKVTTEHLTIFEMGFGTGLNALLSCLYAMQHDLKIEYHSLEAFPLDADLVSKLNYPDYFDQDGVDEIFTALHKAEWNSLTSISKGFSLMKIKSSLQEVHLENNFYDLVYFDAFAPSKQEELWTAEVFDNIYKSMKSPGILSTYSAAGRVKRNLKSVGFTLSHPQGAHGKREMTVARK